MPQTVPYYKSTGGNNPHHQLNNIMSVRTFKVNVMFSGTGSRFEYIDATNANQARNIAESRFGDARIGSVNLVN